MTANNYDNSGKGSDAESSTVLDWRYIKGILGLLKATEVIASLVAYILVEVATCMKSATAGYYKFVTMGVFTVCACLWVFLMLKLQKRVFRCDCCHWALLELGFYVGAFIFYLFANLFCALHACDALEKAACFFGFVAFAAIIVDGVLALREFLASRKERAKKFSSESTTAPPTDARY